MRKNDNNIINMDTIRKDNINYDILIEQIPNENYVTAIDYDANYLIDMQRNEANTEYFVEQDRLRPNADFHDINNFD